ncbi:hypothetical protein MU516_12665 [Paracoccus sp. YLB-12]|uniref:Uncharacterized protein n=1 Tax=Paracoccus maritimus TaxID=2933292 RepID=A0ABT2KBT8_9RHOB|nr:hypothetical protein [Paracoccus sp. YLB-12]MCT4333718.1 hypothetical protein [Paracoccus sp. YLB-12]
MPAYPVSRTWSASIAVAAGDVVQNHGHNAIYVCPSSPADEGDAIQLAPGEGFQVTDATEIFAATLTGTISRVAVIRGL